MANYSIHNTTAIGGGQAQVTLSVGTYQTQLCIANTTNSGASAQSTGTGASFFRRAKVYDMLVGTVTTPADAYCEWNLSRALVGSGVSAGSISSLSSTFGLDVADAVGYIQYSFMNSSNESGISAGTAPNNIIWYVGVNQRASYRWVAAPGSEFVLPAVSSGTNGNGLVLRTRGCTVLGTGNILFQDQ